MGSCAELLVALQHKPNTRPYSQYPPSLYALKDWWDKRNVTWFLRRKHVKKLSIRVIAVEFVYSIKTRRRFYSHANCSYRLVLARFTSLLFAMRTSTIATAYIKVTMITSTHFAWKTDDLMENARRNRHPQERRITPTCFPASRRNSTGKGGVLSCVSKWIGPRRIRGP